MSQEQQEQVIGMADRPSTPLGALPENDGMRDLREKMHQIRTLALSAEETAMRMHALMTQDYQNRNKRDVSTVPISKNSQPREKITATTDFHLTNADKEPSYHPDTGVQDELDELLEQEPAEPILGCKHYKRNVKVQCYDCQMWFPLCNKSAVNMELQWRKLDDEIRVQPMPEEDFQDESDDEDQAGNSELDNTTDSRLSAGLADLSLLNRPSSRQRRRVPRKVWVGCNDCGGRGWTPFHWLGLKCPRCDGYNTNQMNPTGSSDTRFIPTADMPNTHLQRQHDFTGAFVLRSFDDPNMPTTETQPRSDQSAALLAQSPTRSATLHPGTPSRSYFLSSSPSSAPSAPSPRSWASSLSPTRLTNLRSTSASSSDADTTNPAEAETDYLTLAMARLDRFGISPSEFLTRVGISPSEFLARLNISPPDFLERFGVSPFDFLQKVGRSLSPMRHYLESLDRDARERVGKAGERVGDMVAGMTAGGRWSRRDVAEGMEKWERYWRNEGAKEQERKERERMERRARRESGEEVAGDGEDEEEMGFWGSDGGWISQREDEEDEEDGEEGEGSGEEDSESDSADGEEDEAGNEPGNDEFELFGHR
ncbi:putative zinc ion binding protein 2 [Elsinoe australis]|uniref:Putative zinc ion binding protein 2 n=1 Tax=Elsinoe australis TaxID=40998 RepID=A0A4U7ALH3_9PEZI|nr:putative zinc ion binding protein 2 [Elsinoe australis]